MIVSFYILHSFAFRAEDAYSNIPRSKRPYDQLESTQRWKRRRAAREAVTTVLEEIDCPADEVLPVARATPADVLHLPTSVREQIRTVPSLHIPSEQSIIQCKKELAQSHATETSTFGHGGFITDPVRHVSVLCEQSSFLAVGGDAGDGLTKLGVTYSVLGPKQFRKLPNGKVKKRHPYIQHFAPLLVHKGSDKYDDLDQLTADGLTPFTGDSAAFPHIFAVLQHFIDSRSAFLNGDWCFLNAVLGLMSPSATHPCPICIVGKKNLLHASRYRTAGDRFSLNPSAAALLTIPSDRIVPTPLHLFLGISNRIILEVFSELLGKELVEETLKQVTTIHSAGCGGKSDLHDLNGPEIRKWLKKDCCSTLLAAAARNGSISAATRATFSILQRWLQQLHDHLLHKDDWEPEDIEAWRAAVDDIWLNWQTETSQEAFPKLHMLRHSLEFAERHRFLGRASEAQIESFHYECKRLYHQQHLNMAHDEPERLRRCLADVALRAVQPFLER